MMLGLGIGMGFGGFNYPFQAESKTLFASLTGTYTFARKIQIDTFIKSLKTAGIWSKLDVFQMYAAPTAADAVVNWKSPGTFNATLVNSPVVTEDRGINCTTAGMSIDSGFNPSTASINYVLNAASLGVYNRANGGTNSIIMTESLTFLVRFRPQSGTLQRLNSSTNFTITTPTRKDGIQAMVRTDANTVLTYHYNSVDNGLINTIANTSTSVGVDKLSVGGSILYGECNTEIAMFFAGGILTAPELVNFKNSLETYLDYIGAGVI